MKPGYKSTGKFLQPADLVMLNDFRICLPVIEALTRLLHFNANQFAAAIQDKYQLPKDKYFEIVPTTGEIIEPVSSEEGAKKPPGVTLQ